MKSWRGFFYLQRIRENSNYDDEVITSYVKSCTKNLEDELFYPEDRVVFNIVWSSVRNQRKVDPAI
jgi:hypothetical protein